MGALMLLDDNGGGDDDKGSTGSGGGAPHVDVKGILDTFARTNSEAAAGLRATIEDLRRENADLRTRNRDSAVRWNKLAESLGLSKDAEPEKIAETVDTKVTDASATVRSTKMERAVEKAANTHSADADLVMALIERDKALDGIADDKLAETADAKVKEYVEKRPNLKVVTTPPRSPRSGPPIEPGDPNPKPAGLSGALRERMIPA